MTNGGFLSCKIYDNTGRTRYTGGKITCALLSPALVWGFGPRCALQTHIAGAPARWARCCSPPGPCTLCCKTPRQMGAALAAHLPQDHPRGKMEPDRPLHRACRVPVWHLPHALTAQDQCNLHLRPSRAQVPVAAPMDHLAHALGSRSRTCSG